MGHNKNEFQPNLASVSPLLFDIQTRFLQIKTLAETKNLNKSNIRDIERLSKHALASLDYALFAISNLQSELPLTSVSAAAAAQDVAQDLWHIAKTYDVDLQIDISKKLDPVFTNEAALKGTLHGLASSLITARNPQESSRQKVVLAVQQTAPKTQRIGVFSPDIKMSLSGVRQANKFALNSRMSAPMDMSSSGVGLVVSGHLINLMQSKLQAFAHKGQPGLGFYVPMSAQLSLL